MILAVAAGGAAGSVARYLTVMAVGRLIGVEFPWGTPLVNVLGSFVMGMLFELLTLGWTPSEEVRLFAMVGVLGGFTTFSSFSLDVGVLVQRGDLVPAATYIMGSVMLSLIGLYAGMRLVRALATG